MRSTGRFVPRPTTPTGTSHTTNTGKHAGRRTLGRPCGRICGVCHCCYSYCILQPKLSGSAKSRGIVFHSKGSAGSLALQLIERNRHVSDMRPSQKVVVRAAPRPVPSLATQGRLLPGSGRGVAVRNDMTASQAKLQRSQPQTVIGGPPPYPRCPQILPSALAHTSRYPIPYALYRGLRATVLHSYLRIRARYPRPGTAQCMLYYTT